MLRLEQGFPDSVLATDNEVLNGYTDHHRLLVPAIATYDWPKIGSPDQVLENLENVVAGRLRSATLAFEGENVSRHTMNLAWHAVKASQMIPDDVDGPWRVSHRDDPHATYRGAGVWTATRNLKKIPPDEDDFHSTRIRERYTLTSLANVGEDDIRLLLERNEASEDLLVATATVYAINKAVSKPIPERFVPDSSNYPTIAAAIRASSSRPE